MIMKGLLVAAALTSLVNLATAQDKRAQMGFMGMRGKKDELNYEEKRAPLGFTGMRGKKAQDLLQLYDKRAPQMGFMGMRGKKDSQDYLWDIEEEKRAQAGFFGMRGKKGPSGFFGMRGKKGPSGFFGMRGKKGPAGFMGVRGKKDQADDDIQSLLQLLQDSALSSNDFEDSESRLGSEMDGKVQLH